MSLRVRDLLQRCPQAPLAWLASLLIAGCSGAGEDRALAAADAAPGAHQARPNAPVAAPCEDWSTLPCGIEIDSHDGVVDCARGVKLCQNGVYGACVADASLGVVSVQAPAVVLPTTTGSRTMSVGGTATSCVDDVCNPFCQHFEDEPDEPYEAERDDVPTGNLSGGSLQSSNLPNAFKNKGSLDEQCSDTPGSDSWNEACQFDQHCVSGACAAWQPGEFGDCQGVDITTPTSCVPSSGGTRVLTVCNRGTEAAPAGVKCYGYSGGSPQFPNSDPGTGDRLLMVTATVLEPGQCESQSIDESVFHQNGIQSVTCNPPDSQLVTGTLVAYPSVNATTSGLLPWSSPDKAYLADDDYASASPANPNGASSGPFWPSASADFGGDGSWTAPGNAYASSPAGSYASASPAAPVGFSGSLGPRYPGGFDNPASAGDTSFANPDRIYSADGSYVTATPANPSAPLTLTTSPSANDASSSWSNQASAYSSNAVYATASLSAAGTSDTQLSGFGLSVPSNAILDSLELHVKWKTDVNSNKYELSAQAMTGASNTAIGSALVKSGTYTIETTDVLTVPAASLAAFSASAFSDANFKVRLRFKRSNGSVTDSTASVDHVQAVLKYHVASTTSSVVYRYFGLGSIPASAQVQLTAEVKWKASAVNSNVQLGMQLYKNWGTASQAAIGSELTRTPAAANTDYIDTTPTLTPSPADLIDTSFAVRLRVVRSDGSTNPDVTASIDYVRITASYSSGALSTHSIYLSGFGLDQQIPADATITSVASSASWKLSTVCSSATLGLQAYGGAGGTALGTEVTDATSPTAFTTATQTVASGIARSDLSDASFGVRVRVSRAANDPDFTAYLDHVSVIVSWTAPSVGHGVTYGNFGLRDSLPTNATVTQIKTEVRWKSSVSSNREKLAFQLFSMGGVALGSEFVDSSVPTSATTRTQTLTGLSLTPAQLDDGDFVVKVRATRSTGSSNPDFTALVDFVRVTLTYDEVVESSISECNSANNWTATKLNPSPDACEDMSTPEYVPFTVSRVFQGLCPFGQGPTWRRFGYTTDTPDGTSVEFRFRSFSPDPDGTCTALPAVTSGDPQPLATASATQDPPVCSTTDPACVLDLEQALGGAGPAGLECLQMDAYGIPSGQSSPRLFDWTVLYDCRDNE